jgi:hypothetical protein
MRTKDHPLPPDFIDDLRVVPGADPAPDEAPVAPELERRFSTGEPLEVVYFGGGLPGLSRTLTPLRWCEKRGRSHVIARCHRNGMEKTFRLERMHLPAPPLENGANDFRTISASLPAGFLEGMLMQSCALGNLPIENALAAHLAENGGFASFFDEYVYGGYILSFEFRAGLTYLSFGYEAGEAFEIHYEFLPGQQPRLKPGIGTHYALYAGISHS